MPIRSGIAWLELIFALALFAILFELVPSLLSSTVWAIDVRNWSKTMWFAVNSVMIVSLVAIRFGPNVLADWRERKTRHSSKRERQQKQVTLKERRETIARIKAAQGRNVH